MARKTKEGSKTRQNQSEGRRGFNSFKVLEVYVDREELPIVAHYNNLYTEPSADFQEHKSWSDRLTAQKKPHLFCKIERRERGNGGQIYHEYAVFTGFQPYGNTSSEKSTGSSVYDASDWGVSIATGTKYKF